MQTFLFADLSGFTALTEAHGDEQVGAQRGFPLVRVGMHTGSAVERDGDWFGSLGCAGAFVQPNRGATALRTVLWGVLFGGHPGRGAAGLLVA